MIIEVKIPSPGESISEVEIASWLVADGDYVEKDQEIAEIESDKATLSLIAEASGTVSLKAGEGNTIDVGAVACTIDSSVAPPQESKKVEADKQQPEAKTDEAPKESKKIESKPVEKANSDEYNKVKVTPVAKEVMKENNLSIDDVVNGLRRISKDDVQQVLNNYSQMQSAIPSQSQEKSREVERKRMSSLRRKLSQRLVSVKNETAMLTTFNEVDMSKVMALRKKYQKQFIEKHGLKLGFMSFFSKAAAEALKAFPAVNSQIDGEEIVTPEFIDIAIAVQTPKGLMVPVVRNVESLTIPEIEKDIASLANKARNNKITIEEMTGGTFTITNGGVFGSMMSTPIINPPQSGILGMHNIIERPVAVNGKVEIRPMMYIALSYDHRVIDGKDSVGFLVKIKEMIENPHHMLMGAQNPDNLLLDL